MIGSSHHFVRPHVLLLHEAFSIHRRLGRTLFQCCVDQVRLVHLITFVPVPQIQEQLVEVIRVIPQEQMAERVVEQIVDVPMPQIPEQIVDVPVPQITEETDEVATLNPQERIQQRTREETVGVLVLECGIVVKEKVGQAALRGENGRSLWKAPPRAAALCDARRGPRCCRSGEWKHTLKTHVCFSVHFLEFRSTPQVWTAAAALRLGAAALRLGAAARRYHRCCRSL